MCCVHSTGRPLPPELVDELLIMAFQMIHGGQRRRRIKTSTHEGEVTTKFERQQLVHICGIGFTVRLESNEGQATMGFIFNDSNMIEALSWETIGASAHETPDGITRGKLLRKGSRPSPFKKLLGAN